MRGLPTPPPHPPCRVARITHKAAPGQRTSKDHRPSEDKGTDTNLKSGPAATAKAGGRTVKAPRAPTPLSDEEAKKREEERQARLQRDKEKRAKADEAARARLQEKLQVPLRYVISVHRCIQNQVIQVPK
jgi:hypothetical protein